MPPPLTDADFQQGSGTPPPLTDADFSNAQQPQAPQQSPSESIWASIAGFGKSAFNAVTQHVQDVGGQASAAFPGNSGPIIQYNQDTAQNANATSKFLAQKSAQLKSQGVNTSSADAKIGAGLQQTALPDIAQQLPHLNDTNKQVASAGGGLAGDVATLGTIGGGTKSAISSVASDITKNAENKALQTTIDAVNPDLTGKKLVGAYKQVVTGGRTVTKSGLATEQELSPDKQAIDLGNRLKDIGLGKSNLKNLDILGKNLASTEDKLTGALKGDPEINFNADKPTILESLEAAKSQMPREFSGIKDSKTLFNNVINFAKEKIANTEDSIVGLRDARTSFDAQAKTEFPSAFKDGAVDLKAPAGRAIKTARDMLNAHLYNTAPNGSEIQGLIGREADILRATDNIAPKAAATHGQNIVEKVMSAAKNHPYVTFGLGAYGANDIAKKTTGIGL